MKFRRNSEYPKIGATSIRNLKSPRGYVCFFSILLLKIRNYRLKGKESCSEECHSDLRRFRMFLIVRADLALKEIS